MAGYNLRFYFDWVIQSVLVVHYYSILLALATFFIGITLYVRAMVMELRKQMLHLHEHESVTEKLTCLKDGAILHVQILKYLLQLSILAYFIILTALATTSLADLDTWRTV